MPSFTRIFKHAHASRDKEKERGRAADPVIATDTSATATAAADDALPTTSFTTTISSPTGQVTSSPSIVNPTPAVPASPDYQGLLSHKSRRKKEKEKEKERARLIRRATGDDLSQHHQHQQWLQQQHHQHQQAGWRPFAEQSAAPSADSQSDAWQKTYVEAGEVAELIAAVIKEIKLRALDTPFLLLPFRPSATPSDLTSARTFIRNYYRRAANIGLIPPTDSQSQSQSRSKSQSFSSSPGGQALLADVKLLDPPALCNILKWLWARLKGGVVGWEVYSLFKVGEQDSGFARTAFSTFIPLAVDAARAAIITDFFDLLASVAAHAKANGLSGRKLSRYAGWWAFEHSASRAVTTTPAATAGAGAPQFTDSYNHWEDAAHATSHMFFAFLRSQIPDPALSIQSVPISLRELERDTEYPPPRDAALRRHATMAVYTVGYLSSIPLAAVRRAAATPLDDLDVMDLSDSDGKSLQWFTKLDNPIQQGLTDESVRILKSMGKVAGTFGTPSLGSGDATAAAAAVLSGGGQSRRQSLSSWSAASDSSSEVPALAVSKKKRQSWSQFEDIGFDGVGFSDRPRRSSRDERATKQASERPHTPSWAEFLSSGFVEPADAQEDRMALQLPHEHVLPPLPSQRQRGEGVPSRATSSQTNAHYGGRRSGVSGDHRAELAGAEVARITALELDESFFWVWITSLAPEETPARRAVFGHCVLVEIKSSPEGHLNQAASVSTKGGSGGAAASVVSGGSGTYARDSAGKWLLVEERVKVAPPPVAEEEDAAAAVVERKGTLFGLRNKLARSTKRRSVADPLAAAGSMQKASVSANAVTEFGAMTSLHAGSGAQPRPSIAVSVAPDQHARIQAAAAALQRSAQTATMGGGRSGTNRRSTADNGVMPPAVPQKDASAAPALSDVSEALKWAMIYDRDHRDEPDESPKLLPRKPVADKRLSSSQTAAGPLQRAVSGPVLSLAAARGDAIGSGVGSRPGEQPDKAVGGAQAVSTTDSSRSASSPIPRKPLPLTPAISSPIATTTVTSRSVIATDADLSKITPRSARPRPEPVKIPPPVLTSPEESPASENGPAAAVPAQETNDASARPVGTQPPSQSGPQSQSQPQSQLQTRATADADPPNFKRRSRSGGRRPANPAVRGAGTAGGLVAAKRAELEQRDAAAKSPSLSPDRSGAVSPSFHQVKFRGSRSATPASIARSARRSGAEEVSSDAADVATKTAPSEGARVEVEKEGEQELRLGRDEKAEHTSTTPPSLPTPQAGEANMLAEMEAHLKRESADAGGSQGAPATDWSRDRWAQIRRNAEQRAAAAAAAGAGSSN